MVQKHFIGLASRKCRMYDRRTGKRIRTKAERKRCMSGVLKGRKLGPKGPPVGFAPT